MVRALGHIMTSESRYDNTFSQNKQQENKNVMKYRQETLDIRISVDKRARVL